MTEWRRSAHVNRLATEGPFDVVVVGGGIIGCAAALDLSSRGLSVALLEQADFAQGTSGRSTKLLHGGIRYLPRLDFSLVAEGLHEQRVLSEIADYLFKPLEFVVPLYRQYGLADAPWWAARGWRAPLALGAGLTLYDMLGGSDRPASRHRRLNRSDLARLVPNLRDEGLRGGFIYSDAQTDDARLVMAVAKTAVRRYGVVACNRMRVTRIEPGDRQQVVVEDLAGGGQMSISCRGVLLTTGAFKPPFSNQRSLGIVASKGAHLLLDAEEVGLGARAVVLPETDDGRVLFIIPWSGMALLGTTDTPYTGDPTHPKVEQGDAEYLMNHLHRYFDLPPLQPIASFAGLRALSDRKGRPTSKVSREHTIAHLAPGLVQVAGGKLTTYRRIAAEACDRLTRDLGARGRSHTDKEMLEGAGGSRSSGADPLFDRYGTEGDAIRTDAGESPAMLSDGRTLALEAVHAARYESAASIGDVLLRRTHVAWMTSDHGRMDAVTIAGLLAKELNTDPAGLIRDYEAELKSEGL